MPLITAPGIGSGLDINGLLEQIIEAERSPTENRLNLKEAQAQSRLSAYGSLKSAVTGFQSSLSTLKTSAGFSVNNVSVGNQELLSASASSIATDGSYSVEVESLAQSHSLASIAFDGLDTVIGTGTLTFDFGTTDYTPAVDPVPESYNGFVTNPDRASQTVEITNANNTVEGVRDAINQADIGVTATVVDDGSGYKLLITSDQQGFDNSLEITVADTSDADNLDAAGLSQLAFNSGATNLDQTQAASDAVVNVNGLQITRESNTVSDAIHGVTLNLRSADVGNPTQVTINQDHSNADKNIANFVSKYNDFVNTLNELTKYGGADGQSGLLLGDSTARTMLSQIRQQLTTTIDNNSQYNSLSNIGITTARDGSLSLDTDKLTAALNDDFDSVSQLFYANGAVTDPDITFVSSSSATQEGRYDVRITQLATKGLLQGEAAGGSIVIDGSNNLLNFTVDGVSSGAITVTAGTYNDMDALAAEIQSRLNASSNFQDDGVSVSVSYQTDHFEITSDSYGSDSTIEVIANNSTLGFTSNAITTDGLDVAGLIGGTLAVGDGQRLSGVGATSGLVLEITGGTTGNRGIINFSNGFSGKLDSLINDFLSDDGLLTTRTDNISSQIDDITEQRAALAERVARVETRYRSQFVALDVLLGQLNTTSDYLTQQLDSIPQIGGNK